MRFASMTVMAASRLQEEGVFADATAAQPGRELVDSDDRDEEQQHQGHGLRAEATGNGELELFTDTAAADGADDGRRTYVDLEAQQRIGRIVRHDLRQRGET